MFSRGNTAGRGGRGGRGSRGGSSTSSKSSIINSTTIKLYKSLHRPATKKAAVVGGTGSRCRDKTGLAVTNAAGPSSDSGGKPVRRQKLTAATASTTTTTKKSARSARATALLRVSPSWMNYQRVFDQLDDLNLQLPFFGSDRMSEQFFKLLSIPQSSAFYQGARSSFSPPPSEDSNAENRTAGNNDRWRDHDDSSAYREIFRGGVDDDDDDNDDCVNGKKNKYFNRDQNTGDNSNDYFEFADEIDGNSNGGGGGGGVSVGGGDSDSVNSCNNNVAYESGGDDDDDDDDNNPIDDLPPLDDQFESIPYYESSFDTLLQRYILRAFCSAFDVDAEYHQQNDRSIGGGGVDGGRSPQDDNANMPNERGVAATTAASSAVPIDVNAELAVVAELFSTESNNFDDETAVAVEAVNSDPDDYTARAINLFGKQIVSSVQLRQVNQFRLEDKEGRPVNAYTLFGVGGSRAKGSARLSTKRQTFTDDYHRDNFRRLRNLWLETDLLVDHPFCGCCASATRVYFTDIPLSRIDSLHSMSRLMHETYAAMNVGSVLYRSFRTVTEMDEQFNVRAAYRGLTDRDQSRCSVLKTDRVQRMDFYRRIYACHAALYTLINWLWFRQMARHRALTTTVGLDSSFGSIVTFQPPPIMLVCPRRLSPLFERVNTVFLELLLRNRRLYFHYV